MDTQFWAGKKVFVTGHTGFKGGWLSLWLHSLGANVKGYSLVPPTEPSFYECAGVAKLIESEIGDIRNKSQLAQSMQNFEPDIVLHLAAQPLVRLSYDVPVETIETNVVGTANLLDAIRGVKSVKAVVVVTSDKCYENKEWHWGYREDEPMGGYDTYSASKACAELITASFRQSFFHPHKSDTTCLIASARAGNVIGGGDWAADRLVPDILRQLAAGEKVVIRSPSAIRPWQHVLEPLSGYLQLARLLFTDGAKYAEAWNFGPADDGAKPVSWMVDQTISLWGSGSWETTEAEKPHEANYLMLDCSKARQKLKWQPVWHPTEALNATVQWHKAWLAESDMQRKSLQQIAMFQQNAQRIKDTGTATVPANTV